MNTTGKNFRCTTFGESHGPALGVIIDGCPPGVDLDLPDIQPFVDRRRPGMGVLSTPRKEGDRVEILSGVFEGKTTGMPIALLIRNTGADSDEYEELRRVFRPGHADFTYQAKYKLRDYRGGGRSSGRETVARVAAGAVAAKCLSLHRITISSRAMEIHGKNDPGEMEEEIRLARESGDSVGGIIEVSAKGCPAGLGDPVFGKLDAAIASAMMGIGSVKGVEIGDGFSSARLFGSQHNDAMDDRGYLSNHAGGILGGISNGNVIVVKVAVKPTPSIEKVQQTIDLDGKSVTLSVKGRHDPCIVPRILPVAEAMLALVLIDSLLEQVKYQNFNKNM